MPTCLFKFTVLLVYEGGDGMDCLEVWARIAILNKQYKTAETIYLEQNQLDKAIKMHQRLHKWDNGTHFNNINLFKIVPVLC